MRIESGTARMVAGVIALVGWTGLAVQFSALVESDRSAPEALWIMLRYFTILANMLIAVILTSAALHKRSFASASVLGGATVAIALVGVVYSLLLRGLLELSGGAKVADFLLHDVMPILVPIYWLAFAPKGKLSGRDPFLWCMFPLVYFGYALARGAVEDKYAYPFLDIAQIGGLRVAINGLVIALLFLGTSFALVWVDRLLKARRITVAARLM